jgi:hypothetical protein
MIIFLTYFRGTYLNGRALVTGVDFIKEKVYAIFNKDEVRFMLESEYPSTNKGEFVSAST